MSIQLKNIKHTIGNRTILDLINLDIHPGELHILLGKNGAGKSTLFKILVGDIPIQFGNLTFFGRDLDEYSNLELAKLRGVLSQENIISFPYTAEEIVSFGRYPYTTSEEENKIIINNCLNKTSSINLKDQNFFTLSGGEKQKIQFARVLAQIWQNPPKFLFMDEPTGSLDIPTQYKILNICKQMTKEGFGIFMILHDLNLASSFADKVTILHNGNISASGNPKDVLQSFIIEESFGIKTSIIEHQNSNFIIPVFN